MGLHELLGLARFNSLEFVVYNSIALFKFWTDLPRATIPNSAIDAARKPSRISGQLFKAMWGMWLYFVLDARTMSSHAHS